MNREIVLHRQATGHPCKVTLRFSDEQIDLATVTEIRGILKKEFVRNLVSGLEQKDSRRYNYLTAEKKADRGIAEKLQKDMIDTLWL